ncbi:MULTISPECIES: CsbD family protein [unclassified Sphingomonas]|uniref:CsbD family protein n=1 Tax=unclassified Sphingomonas TaxID=196159 RepID=UPI0006F38E26|nr:MULTISPECIES: CsbD family protein [unclassified Sphingomonas]KQM98305.1 general stress protein CsbD [Sphingomonas sp. Leaf25]KQN37501.1 general stress protein CsbD [Sphingomonas sp. Leaf42]KQT27869.1 general stress protein CsbD [Sphingomonas sp. Leaf407]
MNTDTLTGSANDLGGKLKEGVGQALGDKSLQSEGKADQLDGKLQKGFGDAKDAVEQTVRPAIDYARQFIRERPFTAATLGGVLGIAIINSLRGK